MQLKLRRSQRDGGVVSKNVIFCLDARADLTSHERSNLARYKLYDQVIYNSDAAKRQLDKSVAATDQGTASGFVKGMVHLAITALRLNVTCRSLERGHHIECKSMEELLAGEQAIMDACQNLKLYLDMAETFDGSEVVIDFSTGEPRTIAQAAHPEPILAPPPMYAERLERPDPDEISPPPAPEEPDATYEPAPPEGDEERIQVGPGEAFQDLLRESTQHGAPILIAIVIVLLAVMLGRCAFG